MNEDVYAAARILLAGYSLQYCASATVFHSHTYTTTQEFKRYFDIGVFHGEEPWILKNFGKIRGEGFRFAISEIKYLLAGGANLHLLPSCILRNIAKYVAFRMGLNAHSLPKSLKMHLTMHQSYWHERK